MNELEILSLLFPSSSNCGHRSENQRFSDYFVSWRIHYFNHCGGFFTLMELLVNINSVIGHLDPGLIQRLQSTFDPVPIFWLCSFMYHKVYTICVVWQGIDYILSSCLSFTSALPLFQTLFLTLACLVPSWLH